MTLKYEHLLGRPFTGVGRDDCFKFVRDFFADNFDIQIKNYARPHDWSSDQLDLMRVLPEREGFQTLTDWQIKDLRPADVLCMSIGESNPNHFAVFVGEDKLVHHLYGKLSREEPFHGFWRTKTSFVLRHPSVPDMRPVHPPVTIEELLRARNRIEA